MNDDVDWKGLLWLLLFCSPIIVFFIASEPELELIFGDSRTRIYIAYYSLLILFSVGPYLLRKYHPLRHFIEKSNRKAQCITSSEELNALVRSMKTYRLFVSLNISMTAKKRRRGLFYLYDSHYRDKLILFRKLAKFQSSPPYNMIKLSPLGERLKSAIVEKKSNMDEVLRREERREKRQEQMNEKRDAHLQNILEQCKKDAMHDDFILDLKRDFANVSEEFEYRDILHSVWIPLEKPKSNTPYSIWQSWVMSKTDFSLGPKSWKSSIKNLLKRTVRPMQKELAEITETSSSVADFERLVGIWEQYEGIGIDAVLRIYKGESGDFVLADIDAFQE
jgi:hypothetical protein